MEFLYEKIPKNVTAGKGAFQYPIEMRHEIERSNFSQESIQKLSDHIRLFLGVPNSVKVKIGIESSDYMLAGRDQMKQANTVGLLEFGRGKRVYLAHNLYWVYYSK